MSVFGVRILELAQCFVDVSWHRDVESPVGVILRKGEDAGKLSGPVDRDGVEAEECGNEIVAEASPVYLTPKLSTTRENMMGKWECAQSNGMRGTGA